MGSKVILAVAFLAHTRDLDTWQKVRSLLDFSISVVGMCVCMSIQDDHRHVRLISRNCLVDSTVGAPPTPHKPVHIEKKVCRVDCMFSARTSHPNDSVCGIVCPRSRKPFLAALCFCHVFVFDSCSSCHHLPFIFSQLPSSSFRVTGCTHGSYTNA